MVRVSPEVYVSIIGQQLQGVAWPAGLPIRVNWPTWRALHEKIGYIAHEVRGINDARLLAVDVPGFQGISGQCPERVYLLIHRVELIPFGLFRSDLKW